MSSNPILPGNQTPPPSIGDVIGQTDLTRWAQLAGVLRYFTEPVDQPAAPKAPLPIAELGGEATFSNLYAQMRSLGVPSLVAFLWAAFWSSVISVLGILVGWVVRFLALLLTPAAIAVLGGLDELRKGIDPAVGILAQSVLAEFLGTELTAAQLPLGLGSGDHIARARVIGGVLTAQLETEFAQPVGGNMVADFKPAQTFAGLAINFGLASGILGLIGGMVPYGHWEELRELGEEVAKNIGLGRLVRRAIQPYIQILVQQPLTWYLNQKYLPTQFPEAMLVNPFTAASLPHDQLYRAMNLLGYSNDKIDAFVKMHQKRLSVLQVKLLLDAQIWDEPTAEKYIAGLGYPAELAGTVLLVEDLQEQRAWIDRLVTELEGDVKAGRVTLDEFEQVLNGGGSVKITVPGASGGTITQQLTGLPLSDSVKQIILTTVGYKVKTAHLKPPHHLSEGELTTAFEAGLVTVTDLQARWTLQGLSDADQQVRFALLLLRLKHLTDLEKFRAAGYDIKQAAFSAKVLGGKPALAAPVKPVAPFPLG
jgi:hypothetical protein